MTFEHNLNHGDIINNSQLMGIFKCGMQGGMRRSRVTNTLVIISDPFKGKYQDQWRDGIFYYTGMGLKGNQNLDYAQNKTLAQSKTNGIQLFLFEVFKPKEYTFIGEVMLTDDPYQENQMDSDNINRQVWIFPLKLKENEEISIPYSILQERDNEIREKITRLSDSEVKARAKAARKHSGKRQSSSTIFERDPYVAENAKRRAKGQCQLCGAPAPFINGNGEPYLESHHIVWLSQGGEDSIENTVALCPNCHRKMHILNQAKDVNKLQKVALDTV